MMGDDLVYRRDLARSEQTADLEGWAASGQEELQDWKALDSIAVAPGLVDHSPFQQKSAVQRELVALSES